MIKFVTKTTQKRPVKNRPFAYSILIIKQKSCVHRHLLRVYKNRRR